MLKVLCYVVSALALGGAGAYLIWGQDRGLGVFAVLFAAILCRVLILNVAERFDDS